jgi:hypothetical protein
MITGAFIVFASHQMHANRSGYRCLPLRVTPTYDRIKCDRNALLSWRFSRITVAVSRIDNPLSISVLRIST